MNRAFNQLDYGLMLVNKGEEFLCSCDWFDYYLIASALMHFNKLNSKQVFQYISECIISHDQAFYQSRRCQIIKAMIQKAVKSPAKNIEPLKIKQEELDIIAAWDKKAERKVLFSLLCYAKYYAKISGKNGRDGYWVTASASEVFRSACVNASAKDKDMVFYRMQKAGLISNSKSINSLSIKVNFVNPKGKTVLRVQDLEGLGYIYTAYVGGPDMKGKVLKHCSICGTPFIDDSTKNNRKRCKKCAVKTGHEYYKDKLGKS